MPSMPMRRLRASSLALALMLPAALVRAEDAPMPAQLPQPVANAPAATSTATTAATSTATAGRYTILPSAGGFVRLDTETGLVSQCHRETAAAEAAWSCAAIPEAEMTRPDRIDALAARVEKLGASVAALAMRVAAVDHPPVASGTTDSPAASAPTASARPSFADEALRRVALLVAQVRGVSTPRGDQPKAP